MSEAAFASPFTLNLGVRAELLENSSNSRDTGDVTSNCDSANSIGLPLRSFAVASSFSFHFLLSFSDFSRKRFLSASVLMFSASFFSSAFSSVNCAYLSGSCPSIPADEPPPEQENNSGIRMAASAMSLIIFISFVLVKVINVSNDFLSLGFDCKVSVRTKNSCYQTLNLSFTKDKQSCQNVKNLLTTFLTR